MGITELPILNLLRSSYTTVLQELRTWDGVVFARYRSGRARVGKRVMLTAAGDRS